MSMDDEEGIVYTLNTREIYLRIAANIELINIYTCINEQIMQGADQSTLFISVTQTLREIRETLNKIEVKLGFQHIWFPGGKTHSFWSYYNKVNIETDKQAEG
jgi:hypothetical protein